MRDALKYPLPFAPLPVGPGLTARALPSFVSVLIHATRIQLFLSTRDANSEAALGALALVKELLHQGATTSAIDHLCVPAITYAAHAKSVRLVKLFVEYGTRCDVTMGGERAKDFSPLHIAVESDPRAVMAVASQIYEKFRAGETGWAENRMPREGDPVDSHGKYKSSFKWAGGFHTAIFAGVPTKNSYEEGILFPEYAEIFQNATSGREVPEFTTSGMRRGIHAWTGEIVDMLVGSGTCDLSQQDLMGRTALHHAAMFGHLPAVKTLLGAGAPTGLVDKSGLTPLHYAARRGYEETVAALVAASGDEALSMRSKLGLKYSDMQAETYRDRHPWQPLPESERDMGGWGRSRGGSEKSTIAMPDHCDLPEVSAEDFDGELFGAYILANKPFIVRGFGNDWRMRRAWRRDNFLEKYGDLVFKTGSIGYASALGKPMPEMTVREYVSYMESTEQEYNNTLYIFQNDIIGTHPQLGDDFDVFPPIVQAIPEAVGFQSGGVKSGVQFYLGPKDTGAQPHTHAHAWNMMAYGRKLWYMWNPAQAFYTTMPIRPYMDAVISKLPAEEQPITCVQEAGDFVYVPAAWGHTALNLEDSIGIAIGFRDAFATPMYINDQW